ncbi:trimethylguanosine synthase [Cocos nucifera]|uniref:Trimethylguanosine synthase n=1 Tax=Cocos nucifera TaxID=13894 RepID=A0A8K0IK01_COCNU|nr:trimethylguanosine synthase [Cocos nucifera]
MQSKDIADVELAVLETSELTAFPCSVQNLRRTSADKTKTPPSLLNPKKQKRRTKQGPCRKLIPEQGLITTKIAKYWHQRYSLFSRYDDGIQMDEEGWFSATPEEIAATHAARASSGTIVIDCFSGVGGNAIQFALRGCHVVAIDIDPQKIGYSINNAKIYGVEDNIDFIVGDFFQLAPFLKADVVFLSPPWGGPSYKKIQNFTLDLLKPRDGYSIFQVAQKITPNIIMFLPRNVDINQVEELCWLSSPPLNFELSWLSSPPLNFEIEESHVQGYTKGITAYFGYTVSGSPGLSKLSEVVTS